MKCDLSILVPTYNQENFIIFTLNSILKNIKKNKISTEVLIGNDCSKDKKKNKVENFIKKKKINNFRIFNYSENIGGLKNIDNLLKCSSGNYVLIIEGDDELIESDFIYNAVSMLNKNNFSFCASNNLIKIDSKFILNKYLPYKKNSKIKFNHLAFGNFFQLSSIIFKKKFFNRMPQYFFSLKMGDWPLYLYLLNNHKGYYLNQASSIYRVHSSGVWSKNNKIIKIQDTLITLNLIKKYLFKNKSFIFKCSKAYLFTKFIIFSRSANLKKNKILYKIFKNTFSNYSQFIFYIFTALVVIFIYKLINTLTKFYNYNN